MSILPSLRTTSGDVPRQPYVDTPEFDYAAWIEDADNAQGSVVKAGPKKKVAVIGAGVAGLTAAYELQKGGYEVTVFEQSGRIGGRLWSQLVGNKGYVELGAMRFPLSEFLFRHYLQQTLKLDLTKAAPFPDPGLNNTLISFRGQSQTWKKDAAGTAPKGFETVQSGWESFILHGIYDSNGSQTYEGPGIIQAFLWAAADTSKTLKERQKSYDLALNTWQAYLTDFGSMSFYAAMKKIFTGAVGGPGKSKIPGGSDGMSGTAWTTEDFTKFGSLGLGSGGFGPLYQIAFPELLRIVINGMETEQKTLGTNVDSFAIKLSEQFLALGGSIKLNTPIHDIVYYQNYRNVGLADRNLKGLGYFDSIVLTPTTRSVELSTDGAQFNAGSQTVPASLNTETAEAAQSVHMMAANKVAALIPDFWSSDPSAIRTLLTDTAVKQVYTLNEPGAQHGICFISYVWGDDAIKQQSIDQLSPVGIDKGFKVTTPAAKTYFNLLNTLRFHESVDVMKWAKNLVPVDGDFDTHCAFVRWQEEPYYFGGFKLTRPGQDAYQTQLFYDYQRKGKQDGTEAPVFLANDCIDWNSGWVEGAFRTALNAVCGVARATGGTVYQHKTSLGKMMSPLDINSQLFIY